MHVNAPLRRTFLISLSLLLGAWMTACGSSTAPVPGVPHGATTSGPGAPHGATAYVTNYDDGTVTPINLATNTAGTPIPVRVDVGAIAITPNGNTAYVTNGGDNTVTPINLATNTAGTPI